MQLPLDSDTEVDSNLVTNTVLQSKDVDGWVLKTMYVYVIYELELKSMYVYVIYEWELKAIDVYVISLIYYDDRNFDQHDRTTNTR